MRWDILADDARDWARDHRRELMLGGLGVVLLALVVWIIAGLGGGGSPDTGTPAHRLVREIRQKLRSEPRFANIEVSTVPDDPRAVLVQGEVGSEEDRQKFEAVLGTVKTELRIQAEVAAPPR